MIRVLIVDDDEIDRTAARRALLTGLTESGVAPTIVEVASGAEAIATLQRAPAFSLIVLDYEMPVMNGAQTARAIRAAGYTLPILVTTGREDEVLAELMAAGASDFLQKSDVTPNRMRRRVVHMLQLAQAETQAEAARAELAGEHQRTAAILDQLPIATVVVSPDRTLVAVNRAAIALFGDGLATARTVDELSDIVHFGAELTPISAALRGEVSPPIELEFTATTGERHIVRATTTPYQLGGALVGAVMVADDVTESRRLLADLSRAVASRDELLAVVSHDLRNPLHAIALAIDELAEPELDPELRGRYVAAMRRSLARAGQLIRDLLDVSRLDAGGLVLECRPTGIRELLDGVVRDHAMLLREAGMAARVTIDAAVAQTLIEVDPQRTCQALGNLVGNAIKYAAGTEAIELIGRRTDDGATVELVIADRGPGIAPDALPHLFDRFYQAEVRRRAGVGLGLAIARGIARAHGGELTAQLRDGGGTEFHYRLPDASERERAAGHPR